MSTDTPEIVICTYRVKPGHESEMETLLATHWPTLHAAGLTTDDPPRIYRGKTDSTYVEIYAWKSAESSGLAHEMPEVMAVWEPMGAICDQMDFPHFDRLDLVVTHA